MKGFLNMSDDKVSYVVYVGRYGDQVMYVGEGKSGREKHLTSGMSHIYAANRYHFTGLEVIVTVERVCATKDEAKSLEKSLIAKYNPLWNKIDTTFDCVRARKEYRGILSKLVLDRRLTNKCQIECMQYMISKMWRDGKCPLSYDELSDNTSCTGARQMLSSLDVDSDSSRRPKKLDKLINVRRLSTKEFIVELTDYFKNYGEQGDT